MLRRPLEWMGLLPLPGGRDEREWRPEPVTHRHQEHVDELERRVQILEVERRVRQQRHWWEEQ